MKIVLVALLIAVSTTPVIAQQSLGGSGDPLQEICTGFMEQSGQGVSGNRNTLCACLVSETKARLTVSEMEIYVKAGKAGQSPPPAIMEKVLGVATTCLTAQR